VSRPSSSAPKKYCECHVGPIGMSVADTIGLTLPSILIVPVRPASVFGDDGRCRASTRAPAAEDQPAGGTRSRRTARPCCAAAGAKPASTGLPRAGGLRPSVSNASPESEKLVAEASAVAIAEPYNECDRSGR